MPIVTVPNSLREKLGSDGTEDLVKLFNEIEEGVKKDNISFVEEKFERRLSEENGKTRIKLSEMDAKFEKRLSEEIGKVKIGLSEMDANFEKRLAQMDVKIERVRADIVKWMFIFWVGQIGVLTGILFAFFK
jgi:archaellum component FlaC